MHFPLPTEVGTIYLAFPLTKQITSAGVGVSVTCTVNVPEDVPVGTAIGNVGGSSRFIRGMCFRFPLDLLPTISTFSRNRNRGATSP